MLKKETIVAITTTINGEKVFIKTFSKRQDDKYIPNYTTDPNFAHDFETEDNALLNINRIINYNRYRYDPIQLEVAADIKKYLAEKSKPAA